MLTAVKNNLLVKMNREYNLKKLKPTLRQYHKMKGDPFASCPTILTATLFPLLQEWMTNVLPHKHYMHCII